MVELHLPNMLSYGCCSGVPTLYPGTIPDFSTMLPNVSYSARSVAATSSCIGFCSSILPRLMGLCLLRAPSQRTRQRSMILTFSDRYLLLQGKGKQRSSFMDKKHEWGVLERSQRQAAREQLVTAMLEGRTFQEMSAGSSVPLKR